MIQKTTLQFLKEIKKNNKKEWFEANRKRFENARDDFEDFTGGIIKRISRFDESIAYLQPKNCTFRQNRDVRFSKDKSPYKINMGMYISKGGKNGFQSGYYFHLEPGGKSMVAGGLWMPMAPELKKVRQEIDYNWDEFRSIIQNKKFVKTYGDFQRSSDVLLSRPPKNYEADNPAIEYIKLKSLIASLKISDEELGSKDLSKKVAGYFETLKPLIDFLNKAVED
jgi:uncharacterized protein (TIGR02453 family)